MGAFSNYAKNALRNHVFKATSWTMPSTLAIALNTSDPTRAGTNTEVTNANAYARQALNPSSSANWTLDGSDLGRVYSASDITFPTATGSWGTITYGSIWDSATWNSGNMYFSGALGVSKAITTGDIFKFLAGGDCSIDFA